MNFIETHVDYQILLTQGYEELKIDNAELSKLEFLGDQIFRFTTYDTAVDVLFAERMLEVIECIVNKTTFEYQNDPEKYINYLLMVNMPFLKGKLEWGTSIRGAWLCLDEDCWICDEITIPKGYDEIVVFMNSLVNWGKESK